VHLFQTNPASNPGRHPDFQKNSTGKAAASFRRIFFAGGWSAPPGAQIKSSAFKTLLLFRYFYPLEAGCFKDRPASGA
jgi:hypothetical protein